MVSDWVCAFVSILVEAIGPVGEPAIYVAVDVSSALATIVEVGIRNLFALMSDSFPLRPLPTIVTFLQ